MRVSLRTVRTWLKWLVFAACVGLFVYALVRSDLRSAAVRLRELGPLALLVLIPYPCALVCDALAWKRLLAALGHRIRVPTLLRVRFASEAIANSAPAGAVWGEALAPVLLSRRTGAPVADIAASLTAKRWLLVRTHGLYVALAAAFGAGALSHASRNLVGSDLVLVIVVAGAFALVALATGIQTLAAHGQVAERVSGALGRARFFRIAAWVEKRKLHFRQADDQITKLSANRRVTASATARVFALWLIEGVETFLILRLLGADLSLVTVMSFDAALSVVRSAAVFAPSGIGVQDVGYLAVLEAYGVPESSGIGAAFVVVKRSKEAFYVALGLVLLALYKRGRAHAPSAAT